MPPPLSSLSLSPTKPVKERKKGELRQQQLVDRVPFTSILSIHMIQGPFPLSSLSLHRFRQFLLETRWFRFWAPETLIERWSSSPFRWFLSQVLSFQSCFQNPLFSSSWFASAGTVSLLWSESEVRVWVVPSLSSGEDHVSLIVLCVKRLWRQMQTLEEKRRDCLHRRPSPFERSIQKRDTRSSRYSILTTLGIGKTASLWAQSPTFFPVNPS